MVKKLKVKLKAQSKANSNENTQNPKENQEKMADEGIQKHSEHTAANKQPESEDNVQNKNKPTRLCNFFIKIKEWREARKNKNSEKAYENAAENNDAAKQEEMKQADTVEQLKEQRKLSDHFETISKLIGISTVLGILLGGFVLYVYLLKINQLSLLPDVINNPSNLIVASTVFIIIFIIIFLLYYILAYLLLPELVLLIQDIRNLKSPKSNHSDKIVIWVIRLLFIIIYLPIIITLFRLLGIFLEYLFPQAKNINISLFLSILITAIIVFHYIHNNLIGYLNSIDKIFIKGVMTIVITLCLLIFGFSDKIAILNFTHAIEIPENSSWYLLHNNFQQNNGSQETNGIDKNDLIKLKQNFKCSILSEKEKAKKGIVKCSSTPEQRNNALYGYMAWNLGDIKFFCPATTDNTKADSTKIKDEDSKTEERKAADELAAKEAKKLAKECIVISGKALQIMPESYISTNTDGIDDGNPENTGHDDPAIDIKTDVRFKNDLNAQSNAGLNNFNVQPIWQTHAVIPAQAGIHL
ncbi:hypothetical protein [Neisseria mucosa]|uniref:hypothetical protein n=1 Tax=Neisseria mucosa TaxID=488 RepID=UPI00280BFB7B|nr:hypothetical protein [Neisseria mucosa]